MCEVLGVELAPDKEVPPTFPAILIGAEIKHPNGFAHERMRRQKEINIRIEIDDILKKNTPIPSHAGEMRGKLGFAQSLLFGRFVSAMMKPLLRRQ